jgi:hypothetical protein
LQSGLLGLIKATAFFGIISGVLWWSVTIISIHISFAFSITSISLLPQSTVIMRVTHNFFNSSKKYAFNPYQSLTL